MRTISPWQRVGIAAAGTLGLYLLYGVSGLHTARSAAAAVHLHTALDDLVPFYPPATLAYLLLIAQVYAPVALIDDWRVILRGAAGLVGMIGTFLVVWLVFPVSVPRGPIDVNDVFTWGVALTRYLDPPSNCFPSAHVADSVFVALMVRRVDRAMGNLLLVSAAIIAWSTVAIHQHWVADGIAGALAAVVADRVAFSVRPLPPDALRGGPRGRLGWALGIYAVLFLAAALPWWLHLVDPGNLVGPW